MSTRHYYAVTYAAAGCLPDSEMYPLLFPTPQEAWGWVATELEADFDDATYLPAHTALHLIDQGEPGVLAHRGTYQWVVERSDLACECAYQAGDSEHEFGCPIRQVADLSVVQAVVCGVPCPHGGTCTEDLGHPGRHVARGSGDKVLCSWAR